MGSDIPDVNAIIASRGTDFAMAMDTDRLWATGIQAYINSDFSMLIFREQNLVPVGDGKVEAIVKNVASIVVPTQILREFHANVGAALAANENLPSAVRVADAD